MHFSLLAYGTDPAAAVVGFALIAVMYGSFWTLWRSSRRR
jgi:hypothetical protein